MTNNKLNNPHDLFFRENFNHPETARDFVQTYLPPEITQHLQLDTLEISQDSFLSPDLQEHQADILYKIQLNTGQQAYIYLLFEHKSYRDKYITLQLLGYMHKIWVQARKQKEPLGPILPLVIYHGQQKWTVSSQFKDLMDYPPELEKYIPNFEYWLFDLSTYSDAEIRGTIILRVTLGLLKYIMRPEFSGKVGEIFSLLHTLSEQETGLEYLETALRYISTASEQIDEAKLKEVVAQLFEEGESLMPTLAEKWLEQGLEKGLIKGREEATLEALHQILRVRFEGDWNKIEAQLTSLPLETLQQLTNLALTCKQLADFEEQVKVLSNQKE